MIIRNYYFLHVIVIYKVIINKEREGEKENGRMTDMRNAIIKLLLSIIYMTRHHFHIYLMIQN